MVRNQVVSSRAPNGNPTARPAASSPSGPPHGVITDTAPRSSLNAVSIVFRALACGYEGESTTLQKPCSVSSTLRAQRTAWPSLETTSTNRLL